MRIFHLFVVSTAILFGVRDGTADEPPSRLQEQIQAAVKNVSPSIVTIWCGKPARHVTGTIVDADGLVVTCGHLKQDVGDEVEVHSADRKPVAGKIVAKHKTVDLALIQIAGKAKWPAVPIGDSKTLSVEDPLLGIGFANTYLFGNSPDAPICYLRLAYRREQRLWPKKDELLTTVVSKGGDSGGPLFDLSGSLVGTCSNGEADGTQTRYVSTETLLRVWKEFAGDFPAPKLTTAKRPEAANAEAATRKAVAATRPSVAEVWVDDRWTGLAVYVGRGFFLTKASELGPRITLVFADGAIGRAVVAARDPSIDLVLLRLSFPDLATGMLAVQWDKEGGLRAGSIVAAVTPQEFAPPSGVVCVATRPLPAMPGILPVRVKDAKEGAGATVTETFAEQTTPWLRPPVLPIQVGDVITHVAGQATPSREEFNKHLFKEKEIGGHPRVAGEAVEVTWIRDGKKTTAWVNLRNGQSTAGQRVRPYSYRYTGFSNVFATDFGARPEHCSAPVVDVNNHVVGLLIAKAPFIESLVLPSADVQIAIDRMIKSIDKK